MHTITIIRTSCMLGLYTTYPRQMRDHVAKVDMLLFHDDFNKTRKYMHAENLAF
jgi:hypothetical protein